MTSKKKKKTVRRDRQRKEARRGEAYRELVCGQQCGIYPQCIP